MIGIFLIIICYFPAKHVTEDALITYRSTIAFQRIGGANGKYEHICECIFVTQILCSQLRSKHSSDH